MESEIWKSVIGFEGAYEVSNMGRVRSLDRRVKNGVGQALKQGMMLTPIFDKNGYVQCGMSIAKKAVTQKVHRLVALHFIENPHSLPEVNHLDLDKTNNRADNLEWCSRKGNQEHASDKGLFAGKNNSKRAKKLTAEKVASLREDFSSGMSLSEVSQKYGLSKSTACRIVNNKAWV